MKKQKIPIDASLKLCDFKRNLDILLYTLKKKN
jgi:hypothetical protein